MGVLEELIRGHDGVVRKAKIRTPNGYLERATQQLYLIELSYDLTPPTTSDPNLPPFQPRTKRDAAATSLYFEYLIAIKYSLTKNIGQSPLNQRPHATGRNRGRGGRRSCAPRKSESNSISYK